MKIRVGFTLIELLVVIAVMSLLASIILVNVNGSRRRARIASVRGSLSNIVPGLQLCLHQNGNITNGGATICAGGQRPIANQPLCYGSSTNDIGNWPSLPASWVYLTTCNGSVANTTLRYHASGESCVLICTEIGCKIILGCI